MPYAIATVLCLLNAFWLFITILGLPGTWMMVICTLIVAWWQREAHYGLPMFEWPVLVAIVVFAIVGEILEFIAGVLGSTTVGGSKRGATGALVGGIAGGLLGTFLIPIPLFGSLVGTCVGAAVGAWGLELHSGRVMRESIHSGVGAGVGRLMGTLGKFYMGILIWVFVTVAAFWP